MMEELVNQLGLSSLKRNRRRWSNAIPCALFCVGTGGLHSKYALFEDAVVGFEAALRDGFMQAHDWRNSFMSIAIILCAAVLLMYPTSVKYCGVVGFACLGGHLFIAFGVQTLSDRLILFGSTVLGLGIGILYAVGVKLLMGWLVEAQWLAAILALSAYAFGHFLGGTLYPFLLEHLHVVPVMYTVGLVLVLVGMTVSDDCVMPGDVSDDQDEEAKSMSSEEENLMDERLEVHADSGMSSAMMNPHMSQIGSHSRFAKASGAHEYGLQETSQNSPYIANQHPNQAPGYSYEMPEHSGAMPQYANEMAAPGYSNAVPGYAVPGYPNQMPGANDVHISTQPPIQPAGFGLHGSRPSTGQPAVQVSRRPASSSGVMSTNGRMPLQDATYQRAPAQQNVYYQRPSVGSPARAPEQGAPAPAPQRRRNGDGLPPRNQPLQYPDRPR